MKRLVLLSCIVAGLFAYLYLTEVPPKRAADGESVFEPAFLRGLTQLTFENGEESFSIQRESLWVGSDKTPIDQGVVSLVLRGLEQLRFTNKLSERRDEYGLGVFKLKLRTDSIEDELIFGIENPLTKRRYIELPRRGIVATVETLDTALIQKAQEDLIPQRPFHFLQTPVTEVEVRSTEPFKLVRDGDGWVLKTGNSVRVADGATVAAALERLSSARSKEVRAGQVAKAELTIKLSTGQEFWFASSEFTKGGRFSGFTAFASQAGDSWSYRIPAVFYSAFAQGPEFFVQGAIFEPFGRVQSGKVKILGYDMVISPQVGSLLKKISTAKPLSTAKLDTSGCKEFLSLPQEGAALSLCPAVEGNGSDISPHYVVVTAAEAGQSRVVISGADIKEWRELAARIVDAEKIN